MTIHGSTAPRTGGHGGARSRKSRLAAWLGFRARRPRRDGLRTLDDHLLRDIGLTRGEADALSER